MTECAVQHRNRQPHNAKIFMYSETVVLTFWACDHSLLVAYIQAQWRHRDDKLCLGWTEIVPTMPSVQKEFLCLTNELNQGLPTTEHIFSCIFIVSITGWLFSINIWKDTVNSLLVVEAPFFSHIKLHCKQQIHVTFSRRRSCFSSLWAAKSAAQN